MLAMRMATEGVSIGRPTPAEVGYLAGIMDGEGYFTASVKTRSFGLRVAMTDECVIDWLHEHFSGSVSRAGVTKAGNRVYTWTLSRQADLTYVLPRLIPLLVCKRAQAEAMMALLRHLAKQPRWDSRPTRDLSNVGKGAAERQRRRDARAAWKQRELELREAIALAR